MSHVWRKAALRLLLGLLVVLVVLANIPVKPGDAHSERWQAGDILLLSGTSLRSRAVRLVQGYSSDYSHVGTVVLDGAVPFVVHADPTIGKVVKQRWDVVIAHGDVSGGALYRVRADRSAISAACAIAQQCAEAGVPFDHDFDLKSADRLYCTELVWRAYRSAGVDLCKDADTRHSCLLPADLAKSSELVQILQF